MEWREQIRARVLRTFKQWSTIHPTRYFTSLIQLSCKFLANILITCLVLPGTLLRVGAALQKARRRKCSICHDYGASVCCSTPGCSEMFYHLPCAIAANYAIDISGELRAETFVFRPALACALRQSRPALASPLPNCFSHGLTRKPLTNVLAIPTN